MLGLTQVEKFMGSTEIFKDWPDFHLYKPIPIVCKSKILVLKALSRTAPLMIDTVDLFHSIDSSVVRHIPFHKDN